jgi:hypothetical protein
MDSIGPKLGCATASSENQDEKRSNHENGERNSDHRKRHRSVVPGAVAPQRGNDSDRQADEQGPEQGGGSDDYVNRETLLDDVVYGRAAVLIRRTQIAVQHSHQVAEILFVKGLIEVVFALDIRFDFGRDFFLGIEWSARRGVQQQKRQGDDDQNRGDRAQQAGDDVAKQVNSPGGPEYTCSATSCGRRDSVSIPSHTV